MSDLVLQFFSASPTLTQIANVNLGGIGASETIPAQMISGPGDYLIRVRELQDFNQFYKLDVTLSDLPLPGSSADLNLDGVTNLADWQIFLANAFVNLSGLSPMQRFQHGDLDLDGDNDDVDFYYFKAAFNAYGAFQGSGGLGDLVQVPEPGTWLLAGIAAVGVVGLNRRRQQPASGVTPS